MNKTYGLDLAAIEKKFVRKAELAGKRKQEWADVLMSGLDADERLLLKFLYAYMPLHDLADYSAAFFLEHVRRTLKVREQMPWGSTVPDELFVHFVLSYRVNNENIDNSREVIFADLHSRVKGLTMTEAVLETNYWCHEQATYIGTDMRTVSPLTIMRTGLGRCGEQSTLAVAALRSIGIPARQVYTPRWAHCDSNHAWVEAWTDGEWRFLGACEPEPILNEGWFRSPSRQAMLVNTRVAADYRGPEEICSDHPWYAEINMLDRYAPVKTITVQVKDKNGMPAEAEVQFQVYNFAEFSTIVTKTTDAGGNVSLMTGLGDLLVHARGPLGWGTRKIDVRDGVWFDLTLGEHPADGDIVELEMVPPAADTGAELEVPEEKRTRHEERVKEGTQIRAGFEAEFRAAIKGGDLARELGLPEDRVLSVLDKARGNAAELARFLKEAAAEERKLALRLLESLREKDLTDTFVPTLADHLEGTRGMDDGGMKPEFFDAYVLCPRVHFEMITPYKRFFQRAFSAEQQMSFRSNPQRLADELAGDIAALNGVDRYNGMATPVGAYRMKITDAMSRDILFVAAARSLGIPARLEPLNLRPQFWQSGCWIDVRFGVSEDPSGSEAPEKGKIRFLPSSWQGTDGTAAAYHLNFTVARLEDGMFRTLSIPFGEKEVYGKSYEVLAGTYRLITGTRLRDGSVKVRCRYFEVQPGEEKEPELVFREESEELVILAQVSDEFLQSLPGGDTPGLSPSGAAWAWLEPEREPSKHLLRELRELAAELEKWDGTICLAVPNEDAVQLIPRTGLPSNTVITTDPGEQGLERLQAELPSAATSERPVVLVADGGGRVTMLSKGYKLGTGAEMLKTVKHMESAKV